MIEKVREIIKNNIVSTIYNEVEWVYTGYRYSWKIEIDGLNRITKSIEKTISDLKEYYPKIKLDKAEFTAHGEFIIFIGFSDLNIDCFIGVSKFYQDIYVSMSKEYRQLRIKNENVIKLTEVNQLRESFFNIPDSFIYATFKEIGLIDEENKQKALEGDKETFFILFRKATNIGLLHPIKSMVLSWEKFNKKCAK